MSILRWLFRRSSAPEPSQQPSPIDEGFGPYEQVFESGELAVPSYLPLLHMVDPEDCQIVLRRIRTANRQGEDPERFLRLLLAEANWRPHVVAAAAVLLHENPQEFSASLWSATDAGSWVAPQLIATLFLVDPDFVRRAKERIEEGCPVRTPEGLSPVEAHSATGPAGDVERSAKNAAALLAMLGLLESERAWVEEGRSEPRLRELLEDDFDDSGEIALRWLGSVHHQLERVGASLSFLERREHLTTSVMEAILRGTLGELASRAEPAATEMPSRADTEEGARPLPRLGPSTRETRRLREARKAIEKGDHAHAESLLDEIWREAAHSEDPEHQADVCHALADRYRQLGHLEPAETFARRAVEHEEKTGRKATLGNHLMFLADLLSSRGRHQEALSFAERALPCYLETLGENHSEVGYISSVVANLRRKIEEG